MRLEGARVLITGASSGIGAATAVLLAARGATVGLVARRRDRLEQVLARCEGESHRLWVADLSEPAAAEHVAHTAWDELGGLDVVVNNAAIPMRRVVTELTPEDLDRTLATDFVSPARLTMAVLPRMLQRDRGVIVNVASIGGRLGIPHETAYCAAKFALCGWSESLALDLWHTGVDVRLVVPGPIDTEIWDVPGNEAPLYEGPKEPPSAVAEAIAAAIEGDRFETYVPDLKAVVEFKSADIDGFLAGAADLVPKP